MADGFYIYFGALQIQLINTWAIAKPNDCNNDKETIKRPFGSVDS